MIHMETKRDSMREKVYVPIIDISMNFITLIYF